MQDQDIPETDQPWDRKLLRRIRRNLPKNLDPAGGAFTPEGDERARELLEQIDREGVL